METTRKQTLETLPKTEQGIFTSKFPPMVACSLQTQEGRRGVSFAEAYLSGLFSNYICRCGFYFGPNGLEEAKKHWDMGHYETKAEGRS